MAAELENVLQQAKTVASQYYRLTGKPLGVTGEVAEYEAARLLDLDLLDAREAGADARGGDGRLYQIKGRVRQPGKPHGRVGRLNFDHPWDECLLVLMNADLDAEEIWQAPRDALEAECAREGSNARNERRQLAYNQFKRAGRQVWPPT